MGDSKRNPTGAETGIFPDNQINIVAADDLSASPTHQ